MSAGQQLAIFQTGDGIQLPIDPRGVSTGERLKQQNPRVYDLLVAGIAEGMGMRSLERATGVHHRTIAAIRDGDNHQQAIATAKEEAKRNLAHAVRVGTERLAEEINSVPLQQLPVTVAIAIDKLQLLDGAPTSISESRTSVSHESLNEYLERVRRIQPVAGGEKEGQKGLGAGAARRAALEAPEIVSIDAESTDEGSATEGDAAP